MLKVDPSLRHVKATPEQVLSLRESSNEPLVNIPSIGTSPTRAYVLGLATGIRTYCVYVFLLQDETGALLVYISEPSELNAEQYTVEESEALRFVESMGFEMSDYGFRTLSARGQEAVMTQLPVFDFEAPPHTEEEESESPSLPTLELTEVAEDSSIPSPGRAAPVQSPLPRGEGSLIEGPSSMFGGLNRADAERFRKAGVYPQINAVTGQPERPPPGPPAVAEPTPHAGAPDPEAPDPLANAAIPGEPGLVFASSPPSGSEAPTSDSIPLPEAAAGAVSAGASATRAPERDEAALERLGRLLSTFALLLALWGSGLGCAHDQSGPDPVSAEMQTQIDIGSEELAQGRPVDAIRTLVEVIEEAPKAKEALHLLGIAHLQLGRQQEAAEYLQRAVEADPKYSVAKNTFATLLIQMDRCDYAAELLREVVRDIYYETPQFAEHNLALAESCLGKKKEAIVRLERLVTKQPQFCLGYLTLSELTWANKDPERTIEACERFKLECEDNAKVQEFVSPEQACMCYFRKGLGYAETGDPESARESFMACNSDGSYGAKCRESLDMMSE